MSAPYYQDGAVTLYHGDCREVSEWLEADVLVTDPPYPGREDLFATDAVMEVVARGLRAMPGFVFWPHLGDLPRPNPTAVHIWHKAVPIHPRSVTGNVAGHHYERVLSYGLGNKSEVLRFAAVMPNFAACRDELTEHPTQKPLDLMTLLIQRTSGIVADPFSGSGSTLVAAKNLGRVAIGVEVDERFCEITANRLTQDVLDFGGAA